MKLFTRQLHSFPCEALTKTEALSKLNGIQQITACTLAVDRFDMTYSIKKPKCIWYTSSRLKVQLWLH